MRRHDQDRSSDLPDHGIGNTARVPRLYVDSALAPGMDVELERAPSHHLVDVLRARVDASVILFRGDGNDYHATLIETGRRARLRVHSSIENTIESPLSITLLQGLSRGERMDATIRQAVELGVSAIRPVTTRRSRVRLDAARAAKKREHWLQIVTSACEQCGRARLPALHPVATLEAALEELEEPEELEPANVRARGGTPGATPDDAFDSRADDVGAGALCVLLDPAAKLTLDRLDAMRAGRIGTAALIDRLALLIGPESGLDEGEIRGASDAGFEAVRLGPRVLRTETAGPAAIAILQARYGDLH